MAKSINVPDELLLLGFGYTAGFAEQYLSENYPQVKLYKTSRKKEDCIAFDFNDENTWNLLPPVKDCIIFFPIVDSSQLKKLLDSQKWENISLVGTTGSFVVSEKNPTIDEDSPVKKDHSRYSSEELIRRRGGRVIFSSGIYGPGKSPVNWLRTGRVKDSPSYVNLIDVRDLAMTIVELHLRGENSKNYIASNGKPEMWSELIKRWAPLFDFPTPEKSSELKPESKKVIPKELQSLGIQLQYSDLDRSVKEFEDKN